jgi:drug/metabolite transporter (DMT)-like permease
MASVALYALLCVIWGSTWLVIKIGYGGLGPFTVAALRFLLAGALLTIVVPALGARWPRGRIEWSVVVCVGVVLFGADYGLIYWGEQFIDSGLTAILFATLPLFTVALAHVYIPGDHITARKLAGTLLAFLGVVALFGESLRLDADTLGPMAAIIVATVCAAAAGVVTKRHGATLHAATLNAPAMLIGGLVLAATAVATGEHVRACRATRVHGWLSATWRWSAAWCRSSSTSRC